MCSVGRCWRFSLTFNEPHTHIVIIIYKGEVPAPGARAGLSFIYSTKKDVKGERENDCAAGFAPCCEHAQLRLVVRLLHLIAPQNMGAGAPQGCTFDLACNLNHQGKTCQGQYLRSSITCYKPPSKEPSITEADVVTIAACFHDGAYHRHSPCRRPCLRLLPIPILIPCEKNNSFVYNTETSCPPPP